MKTATQKKRKSMGATLGQLGGRAVVKKFGKAYMKKLSLKAVKARWGAKRKKK